MTRDLRVHYAHVKHQLKKPFPASLTTSWPLFHTPQSATGSQANLSPVKVETGTKEGRGREGLEKISDPSDRL